MLPQTRVRPATISAMLRVVILTSLKLILGRFVDLRKSKQEKKNRLRGASVVALSLIYSLDQRYRSARWIAGLRAEPVIGRRYAPTRWRIPE